MAETGVRVILWCVPRSVSTTLLKCLSFVHGAEVWFEPYYWAYLARFMHRGRHGEDIPLDYVGNEEAVQRAAKTLGEINFKHLDAQRLGYDNIQRSIETSTSKHVIVKDITLAMQSESQGRFMPTGCRHVFLTRNPARAFRSYRTAYLKSYAHIHETSQSSFDFERDNIELESPATMFNKQLELLHYVKENVDPNTFVIDAEDLTENPGKVLKKFCELVGLPYSDSLLAWDPDPSVTFSWKSARENITIQGENFYGAASRSSNFVHHYTPPMPLEEETDDVKRLTAVSMDSYNELLKYKIGL